MKRISPFFKISLLAALLTVSYTVHAEYYIVYPSSETYYVKPVKVKSACCRHYRVVEYVTPCCYAAPIVYIKSSAPHRYSGDNSGGTPDYEWITEDPYQYDK